jgi:hypothetical protein
MKPISRSLSQGKNFSLVLNNQSPLKKNKNN